MTIIKFASGESWDVVDCECEFRPCFTPGFDKGVFAQGRGYTRYYDKPRPVCWRRHVDGCPHKPVEEGTRKIGHDGQEYVVLNLLDPLPCCESPNVAPTRAGRPGPYQQRCRSCGSWLRGWRLARAKGTLGEQP